MSEFIVSTDSQWLAFVSQVVDMREETGKPVKLTLKSCSIRSLNQNSTYWMWLGELSHQIKLKVGDVYSVDDLHEWFKEKFCPNKIITMGKNSISIKSTKKLDTGEMHFYMNQLHEWAVNAGFALTVPIESEYRKIIERQSE